MSLISLQTVRQIGKELGRALDNRRFRANVYFDLTSVRCFAEDDLVGRRLRLGLKVEMAVLEQDPRCRMISLDPDTGEHDPEVFRKVARAHEAFAGAYCAVLVEGVLFEGDAVEVID